MATQLWVRPAIALLLSGLLANGVNATAKEPVVIDNDPSKNVTTSTGVEGQPVQELQAVREVRQSQANQPKDKLGVTSPEGSLSPNGFLEDGVNDKGFMMPAEGFSHGRPVRGGKARDSM
jgi:CO dehydrogenase nickel-insertion accessory protein CooC1